jgi:predicted nucleic acid-binding protein
MRVRALAGRERLIVSVITYAGLLTGARLGDRDQGAVRGFFAELIDEVHDVDRWVAERAAELRATKPSLKMPDALILATADLQQADVVMTGGLRSASVGASSFYVPPRTE